jgi:hypothetical protein
LAITKKRVLLLGRSTRSDDKSGKMFVPGPGHYNVHSTEIPKYGSKLASSKKNFRGARYIASVDTTVLGEDIRQN